MKKSSNKKNLIVLMLLIIVLAICAVVYVLSTMKTSLELTADKQAYFPVDEPVVKVVLLNQKNGVDGSLVVTKSDAKLTVKEVVPAKGVTYRELDNDIIFTLSNEYFSSYTPEVAKITFNSSESGKYELTINTEKTLINSTSGKMEISVYKNASLRVGLASANDNERPVTKTNQGTQFGT